MTSEEIRQYEAEAAYREIKELTAQRDRLLEAAKAVMAQALKDAPLISKQTRALVVRIERLQDLEAAIAACET